MKLYDETTLAKMQAFIKNSIRRRTANRLHTGRSGIASEYLLPVWSEGISGSLR